jgi:hypothetical protein
MKLVWVKDERNPLILWARMQYDHGAVTTTGMRSEHLDPVQDWCMHNRCGRRTSFEMFKFRNKEEVTMFLLKWG